MDNKIEMLEFQQRYDSGKIEGNNSWKSRQKSSYDTTTFRNVRDCISNIALVQPNENR